MDIKYNIKNLEMPECPPPDSHVTVHVFGGRKVKIYHDVGSGGVSFFTVHGLNSKYVPTRYSYADACEIVQREHNILIRDKINEIENSMKMLGYFVEWLDR